jgi:hypothetical protein
MPEPAHMPASPAPVLDGFMNAEGIVEGNVLTPSATVSAGMTPAQQSTMTF